MTKDFNQNELAEMKAQIQKQGRLLRWSMGGWIVAISLLTLGVTQPAVDTESASFDKVSVKRLALVDRNGTERLLLATNSSDVRVNGRVYQRRSPASGIILHNAKGDEVGGLVMLDDGTISVTLDAYTGSNVYERASLFVFPDGRSGVLVKDNKGQVRARMGTDSEMNAVLELAGEDEAPRIVGRVAPNGEAIWEDLGAK